MPTKKGIEIIEKLSVEDVKSPSMTGEWEYRLNLIEEGKQDADEFIRDIEKYVVTTVNLLKEQEKQTVEVGEKVFGKCPNCNSDVVKNKKGYGCSNWQNGCKFQLWDTPICGKKLTQANVKQLLEKGETNLIKGFVSKRTGKGSG